MDNRIKIYMEMSDEKSFIKTYTRLVQFAGAKEAIVLGNLASMEKFYYEDHKLVNGYFFSTYEKIANNTGLTVKQVISAVKELEDRKLIITYDECKKGIKKKYYRVNHRMVNRYLTSDFDLIILGSLISLQKHYESKDKSDKDRDWLDKDGCFTCSIDRLIDNTGLDENQVEAIVKDLGKLGFIFTKIGTVKVKDKKTKEEKTKIQTFYKVDVKKASEYLLNIPSKESENIIADSYEEDGKSSHGSFFMTKKKIAQKIDPISAIVFADIWASFKKALQENSLQDGEWFYVIQDKISSRTHISRKTICRKYLPILKKDGLIDMEVRGFQPKTYIRINFDRYDEILDINTVALVNTITKEESSKYEALTHKLVDYAEAKSGMKWGFDFYKVNCIQKVVEENSVTEEQLKQIIDFMYAYYSEKNKLEKKFTFSNVIGQPSTVRTWLAKIANAEKDAIKLEEAKKVTESICNAMKDYTNNDVDWAVDSNKADIIRKVLSWEEGFTEVDLINHAKARYDWCKDHNKKMTAFYKLFSKNEKEHIVNSKKPKQYKSNKNNDTADGVKSSCSSSYTQKEIEEFRARAAKVEAGTAVYGDDVF